MSNFPRRHGFTLFEVAISMAILAMGVTSVLLLLPRAVQTQQYVRCRIFAATTAMHMVDAYAKLPYAYTRQDTEATAAWDTSAGRRNMDPDIELRASAAQGGLAPLPSSIARRIDSEGDEIRKLLDDGGYVYYLKTMAFGKRNMRSIYGSNNDGTDNMPVPGETSRILVGVVGPAQQNAIITLAQKAWPYYAAYPSPPMYGIGYTAADSSHPTDDYAVDENAQRVFSSSTNDPSTSYQSVYNPALGYKGYWEMILRYRTDMFLGPSFAAYPPAQREVGAWYAPTSAQVIEYAGLALGYCIENGLTNNFYDFPSMTPAPGQERTAFVLGVPEHVQVNAMRFLAHSMTMLTRHYPKLSASSPPAPDLTTGVDIPALNLTTGVPGVIVKATHDKILRWHESCLNLATRFASERPYDWGAPRPLNRAISMDQPLMQWDFFPAGATPAFDQNAWPQPALVSGTITGSADVYGSPVAAYQWRAIAAQPVRHFGVSFSNQDYSGGVAPASLWGDDQHFNLTAPFEPSHRARQLVYWAADWQSYADVETAPSAPVDASRYAVSSPEPARGAAGWDRWAARPGQFHVAPSGSPDGSMYMNDQYGLGAGMNNLRCRTAYVRVGGFAFDTKGLPMSQVYSPLTHNPEYPMTWIEDLATSGSNWGNNMRSKTTGYNPYHDQHFRSTWFSRNWAVSIATFKGEFGADRNGNGFLDQGPLPVSARIRATTLMRYNIYDLRIPATIR